MNIPSDVQDLVRQIFLNCNQRVSSKLSRIPNIHETSLDHSFIEHFTHHCRPVETPSQWTVRLDCHFIGGGRHWDRWEVADFGILVVFRHKGKVLRTKAVLLQSKRLFPREAPDIETNPLDVDLGFNFLFVRDERWADLVAPRDFTFDNASLYRSLQVGDEQYEAIKKHERRFKIPIHYLLYNPLTIPSTTSFPIIMPETHGIINCEIGCRVVPAPILREMVEKRSVERPPSYSEVATQLQSPFAAGNTAGGWCLESYIVDWLMACKDGMIDETPQYQHLSHIFSQKSAPIHAAVLITFDMPSASALE